VQTVIRMVKHASLMVKSWLCQMLRLLRECTVSHLMVFSCASFLSHRRCCQLKSLVPAS